MTRNANILWQCFRSKVEVIFDSDELNLFQSVFNNNNDNNNDITIIQRWTFSQGGPSCQLFPDQIRIWKCWILGRRKILRARTRTTNKLNPQMMVDPGMEPRPQWWEASAFTTVPSLLPCFVFDCFYTFLIVGILNLGRLQRARNGHFRIARGVSLYLLCNVYSVL